MQIPLRSDVTREVVGSRFEINQASGEALASSSLDVEEQNSGRKEGKSGRKIGRKSGRRIGRERRERWEGRKEGREEENLLKS